MPEYPIVVREISGQNRLGVEEADEFQGNLRNVISEGYERIDVETRADGEQVGTVVATADESAIQQVQWED